MSRNEATAIPRVPPNGPTVQLRPAAAGGAG